MKKIILILLLSNSIFAQDISSEIQGRSEETGIKEYEYDIKDDNYLLELSYGTNFGKISEIQSFRGQITWFNNPYSWIGYASSSSVTMSKASRISGNFDADTEKLSVLEVGPGISRRSKLITHFLDNQNVYDETMFALIYSNATSPLVNIDFSGFGMLASYGIFYRTSKSFHWSVKLDYHLSSLTGKDQLDRKYSTTLSWISSAIGMGFYF